MTSREHDLVVYGATSFVGQILCRYLVERHGTGGELAWAIAGRNAAKLEQVAEETGADVPRIVADADDREAITEMVESAASIATTVGPYALYGSELVRAVAEAGTDYCDLTGEPQWVRAMIDEHEARARETGARIVPSCGFDSVPSDLGVWFLQQQAQERFGATCERVRMGVESARGGFSGGTAASMMNLMEEVDADPAIADLLADPYALAPSDSPATVDQPAVTTPEYDEGLESWQAPFVMAAANTKVVLRTHGLEGQRWGRGFTYGESMLTGDGRSGQAKAWAAAGAVGGLMGLTRFGPMRALMGRLMPEPGEGPSPDKQEAGYYHLRFHGRTADGDELTVRVTGDRDPGYGSTARILGEAAICLPTIDRTDVGGGFWTPATAMGDALIERLEAHAGLTFEVV